jgi:hypothetical protein
MASLWRAAPFACARTDRPLAGVIADAAWYRTRNLGRPKAVNHGGGT